MTRCRPLALLAALLILGMSATPDAIAQKAAVGGDARDEEVARLCSSRWCDLSAPTPARCLQTVHRKGLLTLMGDTGSMAWHPGVIAWNCCESVSARCCQTQCKSRPARRYSSSSAWLRNHWCCRRITVTADVCVTATQLKEHPQLQTLWQQARDGASVRTELMARFRYHVLNHEESYELKADGPTAPGTLDQTYVSDPKWAVKNAARNREQRLSRGYYGPSNASGDGFYVPHELDVLHEDFLKAHCFVTAAARGVGEVGLRFRPLRTRRNFLDILGTIWLDSATYLARRLELEYVDFDESRGTVRVDFADVPVAGGTLRMPVGGAFAMRPSRKNPTRRTEGKLTITYSGFEEVPPR